MPLTTLLLDLDDTILDEQPGRRLARAMTVNMIAEAHPPIARDQIERTFDECSRWFWSDDERHRIGRLDMAAARRFILGRVLVLLNVPDPEFAAQIVSCYQQVRDEALVLVPGALPALDQLRRRFKRMGLITNGAETPQLDKVQRFGLAPFFDHIQVEGGVGCGKPDPAAFRQALEALSARAEETLMVGNDFVCDIAPARALGMATLWICPEPGREPAIRSLADLPSHPLLAL